jgi:glycogen debranching enzyme
VFQVEVLPGASASLFITVACEETHSTRVTDFFRAYRDSRRARRTSTAQIATVSSSNGIFDEVACRATSDVYTLVTRNEFGPYPYAGIPWFSTMFGRDGIVTAMLMLWVDSSMARGVLRTLAATQATDSDGPSDAQPGKIVHELRHGEMANLRPIYTELERKEARCRAEFCLKQADEPSYLLYFVSRRNLRPMN